MFPLYHLHLHRIFYALLYAVTPRKYDSLYPLQEGSKERLQSEREFFLPCAAFSLRRALSKKTTIEKYPLFHRLYTTIISIPHLQSKCQPIFYPFKKITAPLIATQSIFYALVFKRSRISSKRRVFAIAFSSAAAFAAASSAAAFSAARRSSSAFASFAASTFSS